MNSRSGAADEIQHLNWLIKIRTAIIVVELITIVLLAGIALYFGTLPKTVPWVVELTSDGEAEYKPNVVAELAKWSPAEATQRYFISEYVQKLRTVSTDNNLNKQNANDVYSRSLEKASEKIDQWYNTSNPITRSKQEYVLVPSDNMAVVRYSPNQWQVTWRETSYRTSDRTIFADQEIQAIFTVNFFLPDTARRRRENPIGMYITDMQIIYERSLM